MADGPYQPASIPCLVDGEETLVEEDPTTRVLHSIVLIALFTGSDAIEIGRRGRHTLATFFGSTRDVQAVRMPASAAPRIVLRLINLVGDRWTRNEALELDGTITYRWGPDETKHDYVASIHIWPERDGIRARMGIVQEEGEITQAISYPGHVRSI